jgi:uncharacterized glyoxalase superfamily protein PhnB
MERVMTTATLQAVDLSVSLTANDLDRSIRFYTEGLGFAISDRMETDGRLQGVMMEAGRVTLGLSQDDFAKGKDRVKGVGMGLYLVTEQELEPLAQRVKEAGIAFESKLAPLPWGPMGFTVRDPDGFRVTVANSE